MVFMRKLYCIISICLIITVTLILYFKTYTLDYELVYKCSYETYYDAFNVPWCTVVDEKYKPFRDTETVVNNIDYDFDLSNYSYVITYKHELKSLNYKLTNPKQRIFIFFPYAIVGNATLSASSDDYIYIYRIKKMNLTDDYHGSDSCTRYA